MVPTLTNDAREIQARRASEVGGVALQPVATQIARKELLTKGDRLPGVVLIQAMRPPRLFPGLNNDRREVLAELVGVDLKPAVLGALEGEGKGRERLGGAQPDEAAFTL